MSDNISRQSALDALKAIRYWLWEIDIPSPAGCPEYVEHHEQIQNMMGVVDGWIKKISEEEPTYRTGHWVKRIHVIKTKNMEESLPIWNCSECGRAYDPFTADRFINFCPECGADMRGEKRWVTT